MPAVGKSVGRRVGKRVGKTLGRGAGAGGSDPVPGLITSLSPRAWFTFEAAHCVVESNLIAQATDRTGNDHHVTQVTESARFTLAATAWQGGECAASDGDDYLQITSGTLATLPSSSAPWSLLAVAAVPPSGAVQTIAGWGDGSHATRRQHLRTAATTNYYAVAASGAVATSAVAAAADRVILIARQGSTTGHVDVFRNGVKIIDNVALTYFPTLANFLIGAYLSSGGITLPASAGTLYKHVAAFPSNLSNANVAAIQSALGSLVA